MDLLVASGNRKKLLELHELAQGLPLRIVGPSELGRPLPDVVEDGATFEQNACQKALAFARATGLPCVADDSGLCVDVLGGAPGVHSARYSGPPSPDRDERNNEKLLEALRDVPAARRGAQFVCALCLALPSGETRTVRGVWRGQLAFSRRGEHGFGYDPLFLLPERGRTSAELGPEEKHRLSHRGQAMRALRPILEELAAGR